MDQVEFQLKILIRELSFQNSEPVLINFEKENVHVIIKKNENNKHSDLIIEKIEELANEDFIRILLALRNNKLPKNIREENINRYIENGMIEKKGNEDYEITAYPINELLSDEFNQYISSEYRSLSNLGTDIINILFWKNGIKGLTNPKAMGEFSFKINKETDFKELHLPIFVSIDIGQGIYFNRKVIESLKASMQLEDSFPTVGHELWREAWHNRNNNPRSACVLAIASIESTLVEYISRKVPVAEWIITNLPKPNLLKILNEYVRKVIENDQEIYYFPLNDELNKRLRMVINYRDNIMHTGKSILANDDLESILIICRDILYMLDYQFGNQWAEQYISKSTKELYNNEVSGI